jgi:hypothetical protein
MTLRISQVKYNMYVRHVPTQAPKMFTLVGFELGPSVYEEDAIPLCHAAKVRDRFRNPDPDPNPLKRKLNSSLAAFRLDLTVISVKWS